MGSNSFRWKKICKGLAAAGLFFCLFLPVIPVFAEEPAGTGGTTAETRVEAEEKKEPESQAEEKTSLPEGNLSLAEDVVSAVEGNKEFLTVVSKDGSYFYIVIDRDHPGAGNVYFLNLVDNRDLFALTGEKPSETETKTEVTTPEPETKETGKEETEAPANTAAQKRRSLIITVGFFAVAGGTALLYLLRKRKAKRKQQAECDLSDFDEEEDKGGEE